MTSSIIIGAGIIGLMTARELLNAGVSVTILDKRRIGGEASWAGSGILSPLYPWREPAAISKLADNSSSTYGLLAKALQQNTGVDPEWQLSGVLLSQVKDPALANQWCKEHNLAFSHPNKKILEKLLPNHHLSLNEPLLLPQIGQIRNPRLIRALAKELASKGAKFLRTP